MKIYWKTAAEVIKLQENLQMTLCMKWHFTKKCSLSHSWADSVSDAADSLAKSMFDWQGDNAHAHMDVWVEQDTFRERSSSTERNPTVHMGMDFNTTLIISLHLPLHRCFWACLHSSGRWVWCYNRWSPAEPCSLWVSRPELPLPETSTDQTSVLLKLPSAGLQIHLKMEAPLLSPFCKCNRHNTQPAHVKGSFYLVS